MAFLAITSGGARRVLPLMPGEFIAGRSPDVALELTNVEISRQHCRFSWDGEKCVVTDLGSVSGTRVNDERITAPTELQPGDKVGVGPVVIEFGTGEPPVIAEASAPARATLMLVRGKPADRIAIDADLIIGRDPKGDVVLNDPGVSRRHAQLRPLPDGGCLVADLHSTAGSFVNGHRFDEHELTVGDRLQIGPFYFQFDGSALVRVANASGTTLHAEAVVFRVGAQTILNEITLTIPASRFVGILGPSGAGKSSLLHAVAGLCTPTSGVVMADGDDVYGAGSSRAFGFVPQEDIVHPELTVAEALRFSAQLRLPADTPELEVQKLIIQTMEQLGLRERAGLPIARLSGGQRKRVSVGVELLAKPAILFLDEPSSGLDPATEFQLMELLRDLADTGCTIVCTTHVMENAYLMDELVVLVAGCLAFKGSPQDTRDYFGVAKLTSLYEKLAAQPALDWRRDFAARATTATPVEPCTPAPRRAGRIRRARALPILLARQWAILRSDPRNFLILLGQPLIIAALVSWVTDERALVMFFAYLATLWFGTSNAAQEIVKEIAIYRRERLVGVGAHAYLTSKFVFLFAITAVQALLLYGVAFLMEKGAGGKIAWQLAGLMGTALAAVGIGAAISALARTVMQAVMIVPLLLIPQIVFSGYTVPASDMTPAVLRVSRFMPTFSAQVVMDTSFLWQKQLAGATISDHAQAYRNLDPDRELTSRDTYTRRRPAALALMGHALWAAGTYLLAWLSLRKRG